MPPRHLLLALAATAAACGSDCPEIDCVDQAFVRIELESSVDRVAIALCADGACRTTTHALAGKCSTFDGFGGHVCTVEGGTVLDVTFPFERAPSTDSSATVEVEDADGGAILLNADGTLRFDGERVGCAECRSAELSCNASGCTNPQ